MNGQWYAVVLIVSWVVGLGLAAYWEEKDADRSEADSETV